MVIDRGETMDGCIDDRHRQSYYLPIIVSTHQYAGDRLHPLMYMYSALSLSLTGTQRCIILEHGRGCIWLHLGHRAGTSPEPRS